MPLKKLKNCSLHFLSSTGWRLRQLQDNRQSTTCGVSFARSVLDTDRIIYGMHLHHVYYIIVYLFLYLHSCL